MGFKLFGPRDLREKRAFEGFLFVLPWIIGFFLFIAWPMFFSLYLGFNKVNPAGFLTRFVGLRNFKRAFSLDIEFVPILLESLRDVVIETPVIIVFSLTIAILLNRKLPGRSLLRALFFLPVVIGSGYVLKELMNQGIGGISIALGVESGTGMALDASGQAVETSVQVQTPNVVNISGYINEFLGPSMAAGINEFLNRLGLTLWRSGIQILLFIAGLQGISKSLYEAGRIDGANEWTLFWKVTLPVISPIMLVVIIFTIVDSFTDVFNPVLHYIKQQAFPSQEFGDASARDFGYSSALSWIYFLIIFSLIMLVNFLMRKRIFYQGER
jgi:ABC-type sugar transport system permease subunit